MHKLFDPQRIHRTARWLHLRRVPKLPALLWRVNSFLTGCDLPPSVNLGQGVRFLHFGRGVVINPKATIGNDVVFMPNVVIGENMRDAGVAVPTESITVGNRVLFGAGCCIIATGHLEIGDDSTIGANAVVLKSVPANCYAVGVPAKIIPKVRP